jgi:hypothetical protein
MTKEEMAQDIVGYDVRVYFQNGSSKLFSWRGTQKALLRKAILKPLYQRAEIEGSYTDQEWVRAHGIPGRRM